MTPSDFNSDTTEAVDGFINPWHEAGASKRANCQLFLIELFQLLGFRVKVTVLISVLMCYSWGAVADPNHVDTEYPRQAMPRSLSLLTPPVGPGPVVVTAFFELRDINEINDIEETFEFTGVLTLTWHDPRQAFMPTASEKEKIFQGNYQFNEVSTGWYPQVFLSNESGRYQKSGVVLRIQPDGTSTLTETVNAVAENELDMRLFPFDTHRLEAVFELVGFGRDEILLQYEPTHRQPLESSVVEVPQWAVRGVNMSVSDRAAPHAGDLGVSSVFVVGIDVERNSFYIRRLVTLPLLVIVLLSFSVFWMERSSLGDRISVSFIGILTSVSYQLLMGDVIPHISYFTLVHLFLFISFLTMSGTVVINLWVGALDKKGHFELGDTIDRRCRWIFPLVYFGLILSAYGAAKVLF